MRLSLWVLIFHRVDFSHFILLLSKYWILSIINQALSKTKELPEIESRYFASEEEFPSLLASRQFIKAVILTDVCRYRFYAIPKHRLTRAHREKQLKMSCQALHNAPPNRT